MGHKSKTIYCEACGYNEFFVDTLGIEHCSQCFLPTLYVHRGATGTGLSYKQIIQAKGE